MKKIIPAIFLAGVLAPGLLFAQEKVLSLSPVLSQSARLGKTDLLFMKEYLKSWAEKTIESLHETVARAEQFKTSLVEVTYPSFRLISGPGLPRIPFEGHEGDKIIRINGVPIRNHGEIHELLTSHDETMAGKPVRIIFSRGDGEIEVEGIFTLAWRGQPDLVKEFLEYTDNTRSMIRATTDIIESLTVDMNDTDTIDSDNLVFYILSNRFLLANLWSASLEKETRNIEEKGRNAMKTKTTN